MKLCALTQSYAPTGGGVRTLLHAQRDYCRTRDMQHLLIIPGASDSVTRDGVLTTYTVASPFVPGSRSYRLLLRSDKVLRILRSELPTVIEAHCAYNLPWTAFAHRRRHGALVSGIFNTDIPTAYVDTPLRRRLGGLVADAGRRVAEAYVRALYRRCDVVIAISSLMQQRLRALRVPNVHHVPLGVDTRTFASARRDPALRAELGAGDGTLLLVYAGRLDREKRPDLLLDAFARLPDGFDGILVLCGDGPLRAELERAAGALTGVRILPFVEERAALARLLASSDVYVTAMAHETFGLSVIEAQACGLPVVGFAAGAMLDRVQVGEGHLVRTGDTAALAHRIAATPREEWALMGGRARARVRAEFSWDRTFDELLRLYRERLARTGGRVDA